MPKISVLAQKGLQYLRTGRGVVPVAVPDEATYKFNLNELVVYDARCETLAELKAALESTTALSVLWAAENTLLENLVASVPAVTKRVFILHQLRGKNCALTVAPGGNLYLYGDLDCATPATGGYSWQLDGSSTSGIKCKWIKNSGTTGKVICNAGTVLYERLESGLILETNGTVGSEIYINQEFWDNTNNPLPDVSDNKNIWYLDTTNGLDTNSGRSRSAPKKTGDAVVIACKTAGKTTGRLVVMAGSSGVVFNATTWSNTAFPFFDVDIESIKTDIMWNDLTTDQTVVDPRLRISNGEHLFNNCSPNGYNILHVRKGTFNSGHWQGQNAFEFEDHVTFNGSAIGINAIIKSKDVEIASTLALHGSITLQSDSFSGSGSIGSFSNEDVFLNLNTNTFGLEGIFSFPSQSWNSSIKITAAKMRRSTLTKLLYLGAVANKTVNYQFVVDTMGSIVPLEIANPAGTVAGKVIELLKYENKVDSEISRATAAEALKANKLTTVNNSTDTAYTFLASDSNTCHIVNTSAATTRTVPSDTTAPDIAIGDSIEVQNLGTGVVTFVAASGVTIRSSLTLVMYGQYSVCMLRKIAANTWILTGERTAV